MFVFWGERKTLKIGFQETSLLNLRCKNKPAEIRGNLQQQSLDPVRAIPCSGINYMRACGANYEADWILKATHHQAFRKDVWHLESRPGQQADTKYQIERRFEHSNYRPWVSPLTGGIWKWATKTKSSLKLAGRPWNQQGETMRQPKKEGCFSQAPIFRGQLLVSGRVLLVF